MSTNDAPSLGSSPITSARPAVDGDRPAQLQNALCDSFDLSGLTQLARGQLGTDLPLIIAVQGRTLSEISFDLVMWAARKPDMGLPGLLVAALRENPAGPALLDLQQTWAGLSFEPPGCPYPGMRPFTPAEQARFYGRGPAIDGAVDALRRHPFLAIIGPSGSGKSSLLAAGIRPRLQTSQYFADKPWGDIKVLRPSAAINTGLELAPTPNTRRLLIVDQLEEVYTATFNPEQRKQFEQAVLAAIAAPDTVVIVACRADFYGNLMASPLWPVIRDNRLELAPLRGDGLRQAIAQPARDVGVELEPQLVERLLADAGDEPGVLPFVQETLVMLWRHADNLRITLDDYTHLVSDDSGRTGLQAALGQHADDVYNKLRDDDERAVARRILLRLVQFGEGRPDTRRQQRVDELRQGMESEARFDHVLDVLTVNRLLTLSDEKRWVDLSHEALIAGWPRLRQWIDERRAAELTRRRLEEKAQERTVYRQKGSAGGLLDVIELAEAQAWIGSPDAAELGASQQLRTLVDDSRGAIEAVALEKERAAQRLRRRNQGLAVALVAALAAMSIAIWFYFSAQQSEGVAQRNAKDAQQQKNAAVSAQRTADANAALADEANATAQANLSLANAELARLDGTRLLSDSIGLAASGKITEAIATYGQAIAADPTLPVKAEDAITGTIRVVATKLITEGEELARSGNHKGASEKFHAASALNPSPDTPIYIWIPSGTFTMGSTAEQITEAVKLCNKTIHEGACKPDDLASETPAHTVTLDGFWMQRTLVTNEQYKHCVYAGKCDKPTNGQWDKPASARYPVTDVDRRRANAYAAWVGGRLPTEAEWEYACRGTDGRIYPWGDDPPTAKRANYAEGNVLGTSEVGSYPSGATGLYDMAGNVWEWTADWFSNIYYESSSERNPTGPEEGDRPTLRGGAWNNRGIDIRCAYRFDYPDFRYFNVGFRVVTP